MTTKTINTAEALISKIGNRIVINSVFPTLQKENEFLNEILHDLKVISGLDVPTELDKLKSKLNGKV